MGNKNSHDPFLDLIPVDRGYRNGTYKGEMKDGKKEGYGIYYYTDGDIYEGEWKNDLPDGKGKHTSKDGSYSYEGTFKEGKKNGRGICYFDDGVYEGEFYNNLFYGDGIVKYNNGDVYDGMWKEGERHGRGVYKRSSGIIQIGVWETNTFTMGTEKYLQSDGTYLEFIVDKYHIQSNDVIDRLKSIEDKLDRLLEKC
jgi:hypothetical protein